MLRVLTVTAIFFTVSTVVGINLTDMFNLPQWSSSIVGSIAMLVAAQIGSMIGSDEIAL